MSFDDPLVVLGCALLVVERSKETLVWLHAVVVPLLTRGGEELVAKEFAEFCVAGAAASLIRQGRTTPARNVQLSREFDPTKGYAGQDILICLSEPTSQPSHQNAAFFVFFFLLFIGSFSLMVLCSAFVRGSTSLFMCLLPYFVGAFAEELARRQRQEIALNFACCSIFLMTSPLFYFCFGFFLFCSGFSLFVVVFFYVIVCGLIFLLMLLRARACLSGFSAEARLWRWQRKDPQTCAYCDTTFAFDVPVARHCFLPCSRSSVSCGLFLVPAHTLQSTLSRVWSLLACSASFWWLWFFSILRGCGFPSALSGVHGAEVTNPFFAG